MRSIRGTAPRAPALAAAALAALCALQVQSASAGARLAAAPTYVAGAYAGATAQGKKITFRLSADGVTLTNVRTTLVARCGKRQRSHPFSVTGPVRVATG